MSGNEVDDASDMKAIRDGWTVVFAPSGCNGEFERCPRILHDVGIRASARDDLSRCPVPVWGPVAVSVTVSVTESVTVTVAVAVTVAVSVPEWHRR